MRSKPRILVVEDDENIIALLEAYLAANGFAAEVASHGEQGFALASQGAFDVLVLDVMLPGLDGFQIARQLRADGVQTPILFLTARGAEHDILEGFSAGADDYLSKPFSPRELIARLQAIIARSAVTSAAEPDAGTHEATTNKRLHIDPATYTCSLDGQVLQLTAHEFRILSHIAASPDRVFDRDQLTSVMYPGGEAIGPKAIDVHVHNLRRKLGEEGHEIVQTVRGFGYRFCSPKASAPEDKP